MIEVARHSIALRSHVIFLWALVISGINLLCMPAFRYGGDPAAIEYVSVRLINSGTITVPANVAKNFGDRGQFFFRKY